MHAQKFKTTVVVNGYKNGPSLRLPIHVNNWKWPESVFLCFVLTKRKVDSGNEIAFTASANKSPLPKSNNLDRLGVSPLASEKGHNYTKHGPLVHGPPLWTWAMDPFMDLVHGLPLWTTPHFVKLKAEKSLDEREKRSLHSLGQLSRSP